MFLIIFLHTNEFYICVRRVSLTLKSHALIQAFVEKHKRLICAGIVPATCSRWLQPLDYPRSQMPLKRWWRRYLARKRLVRPIENLWHKRKTNFFANSFIHSTFGTSLPCYCSPYNFVITNECIMNADSCRFTSVGIIRELGRPVNARPTIIIQNLIVRRHWCKVVLDILFILFNVLY